MSACGVKGCVAVANTGDSFCAVHRVACSLCGYTKEKHPLWKVGTYGPQLVCERFASWYEKLGVNYPVKR